MRKFDSELFGQIKLQRLSHYRGGWAVVIAGQRPRGGGGTPIHYQEPIITLPIYGYVPPNGVVILKLLI